MCVCVAPIALGESMQVLIGTRDHFRLKLTDQIILVLELMTIMRQLQIG